MTQIPRVSVVIPTYNRSAFLKRAVESVLSQTFTDFEIVIVDDGSTDDTESVVRDLDGPIHYIKQPKQGASAARNHGIDVANGELIAFLDSDDEWLPRKLELQVPLFDDSEIGIAYCGYYQIYESDNVTHQITPMFCGQVYRKFVAHLMIGLMPTPSVVARRHVLQEVDGFATDLKLIEDNELWIRIARYWQVGLVPTPLIRVYLHSDNTNKDAFLDAALEVAHRVFSGDTSFGMLFRRRVYSNIFGITSYAVYNAGARRRALFLWIRALSYWPLPSIALARYARRLSLDLLRLAPRPVRESIQNAWRRRRVSRLADQ